MRFSWPPNFPPVYVHVPWVSTTNPCLRDHPSYRAAKKRNNAQAALAICDDLCDERVLTALYDACQPSFSGRTPLVVSPTKTLHESRNALSRAYARWLAKEMEWAADGKIFQSNTVNRDLTENGWSRLVNEPQFKGVVENGRPYVLADDVCTARTG
jgi:hypothetical protein